MSLDLSTPERFEHWMEVETSYALLKFPPSANYAYFAAGVNQDHFNFGTSAINYVQRASIFAAEVESNPAVGLQLVQSLGKAAHNLVALQATAHSYWHDSHGYVGAAVKAINDAAEKLQPGVISVITVNEALLARIATFEALQTLQEDDDRLLFETTVAGETVTASSLFVAAAERYGWTMPGQSSGNVNEWLAKC